MGKSQQTFNKQEREKKKSKKKQSKMERREQRKLEKAEQGKLSLQDQLMYVDENGNLTSEKPDPSNKFEVKAEDISLSAGMNFNTKKEKVFRGKVKSFQADKGYGFIINKATKESVFVHINDAYEGISQNHIVDYETEKNQKGVRAVNVVRIFL